MGAAMSDRLERRLVAVMFTDMVGYTALMQSDESVAREKRLRYFRAVEGKHDAFGGTIVKRLGDGTLSTFTSSLDASQAAVEIQRELAGHDVPVRIGIHVGEVIVELDDLIGDAVNVASRIESFAVPGGVMLSDSAYDQIRNRSDIGVVALGKFRLKNVGRPFELFAVDAEGIVVPSPETLEGKGERYASLPSNLPVSEAPLLGRQDELHDLFDLVREHRIVTLTGTGGVGKTRLAIELARLLSPEFLDGVSFVSMAEVSDPDEFVPALATALDVKESEERTLGDGVAALIGDMRALVVLDNLEQVVAAVQEVAKLVERCPRLHVIATSRAPLRIGGEREFSLDTLDLPSASDGLAVSVLLASPAVAFFVDRARNARSDFELTEDNAGAVFEICSRLDGLPLALELASSRLRLLSPQTLLERLSHAIDALGPGPRDAPQRQQTLRATIDWSYSLLGKTQQRLFRRMAVFVGGCQLDDLEAICADPEGSVLDDLETLVDHALVRVDQRHERFSMLQTILAFANELLASSGDADSVSMSHARRFAALTEELRGDMEGDGLVRALERGFVEDANVRGALDMLLSVARAGDAEALELGLQSCGNLLIYWHVRGQNLSARERAVAFLGEDPKTAPTVGRSRALLTAGLALWMLGRFDEAIVEWTEAYEIATALDATRERCLAPFLLGLGLLGKGDSSGRVWTTEGIERSQAAGFLWAEGLSRTADGLLQMLAGDFESALEQLTTALTIQKRLGDHDGAGVSLSGLAALASGRDDLALAVDLYEQALAEFEACGDRAEEARVLGEVAWVRLRHGDTRLARQQFFDSVHAYSDVGSVRGVGIALTGLAATEASEDRPEKAVQLAAAAEVFAREEGIVNVYSDETPGREAVDRARDALSSEALANATALGQRLSLREALDFARSG
jgi:predicted ATPase/class 3 adenylate cyclase